MGITYIFKTYNSKRVWWQQRKKESTAETWSGLLTWGFWCPKFKPSFFLRSQVFTLGMRTSLVLLAKCLPRNCSHYLQNTSGSFSLKKPMYMMEESKFINWKTETFNVRLTSSADWLLCNSKNIVVESQTELSQSVSIFAGFHKFSPSPWSVSDLARKYVMNLEFCSEGRRSIMVWGKR